MHRSEARDLAMKLFFQMEAQNDFSSESQVYIAEHMDEYEGLEPADTEYLFTLSEYFGREKDKIDAEIDKYSKTRSTKRIPKPELAILRLAICELDAMEDVPTAVAIDEAVELAKTYGSDEKSAAFVNGVLGNIVREVERWH